jgi:putative peptidoglycan lipid II flippase
VLAANGNSLTLFTQECYGINVYTDIRICASYFANPSAADVEALKLCTNLLGTNSFGNSVSMILVPFLPIFFSKTQVDPREFDELKQRIRRGLLITATAMLPWAH